MSTRANIPDQIKLKLWVLSGGRCEFPGCNKYVWRDGLTLQEDNFSHMAHIVAASPNGPRGDQELSPAMAKDFDNLMLVCLNHSHLVDGVNRDNYTIEGLQRYKQEHESRIRRQTDLQPEMTTTVLRFMAKIGDLQVQIPLKDAHHAILPRFPGDDRGILMDFTNRPGRGASDFWTTFASEISRQVERDLAPSNAGPGPSHISVFALGPMPLLVQLGRSLGNTVNADLYQRHRDTQNWRWKDDTDEEFEYLTTEEVGEDEHNVAVVLSLSGKVHSEEIYRLFEQRPHLYEIAIADPNPHFLTQRRRLELFRKAYRELLGQIRERHGPEAAIHLFPAAPAPIAVLCGRELLPKADPRMIVYDHERDQGGFVATLTIN